MKKTLLTVFAILASASLMSLHAADEAQGEKEVKKGWSFGLLPTATYSVDNGFQAGAFGDVYYYGDGKTYPDPLHKISWEASYFTKSHRVRLYMAYDSKYLIPGMRVNASLTYMTDPLYSFWGFNGAAAVQDYDLWSNREYVTPAGYNVNYFGMNRSMLRGLANFQGRITDNLNWAAGVNFWRWTQGDMNDGKGVAPKGSDEYIKYDASLTQFRKYQEIGAIKPEEAAGGLSLELNAGLVFDTRDMEAAPNRGIWAEAYLNGAPYAGSPSTGLYSPYLKACMYFRHYVAIPLAIPAGEPVFAYRLAWQQTLLGETPLYMIQNNPLLVQRNMISEGFGSSNTIRGLRENRILAEGMAWANLELRVKLVKFKLLNQFFYLAVNPFFDAGIITKGYREGLLAGLGKVYDERLIPIKQGINPDLKGYDGLIYDHSHLHDLIYSAGAGLKIAMNQNFIVSADFAKCFTPGLDAGLWIGIGINYQF